MDNMKKIMLKNNKKYLAKPINITTITYSKIPLFNITGETKIRPFINKCLINNIIYKVINRNEKDYIDNREKLKGRYQKHKVSLKQLHKQYNLIKIYMEPT